MNIFKPYTEVIKKALEKDPKYSTKLYSDYEIENYDFSYINELRNELPGLEKLNETFIAMRGNTAVVDNLHKLGHHPDFIHLKNTKDTEKHWIISAFVDVKESTRLHNRFSLATVALITEGIVKASIFAVNYCGGYVHRIQGDGLMVYFGGKNIDKEQATKDALKAFSMISYFVKNDLKELLEAKGIREIYTRTGIDLGHNNQVLWMYSGLGETGEITTCSLHTSLAPKMQSKAASNGIVVGEYIVDQVNNNGRYFKEKTTPIWDFEDGRFYKHYDFDWERYLVDNNLAKQDINGNLILAIAGIENPLLNPTYLKPIAEKSKPYYNFE
ncbi:hypothetical protein [Polaribacter marinivivus]|uniref:hypothetical protein n=1 Tax=Polaribacter marinivivus TaxID=1524260 RepID=UPI003D338E41